MRGAICGIVYLVHRPPFLKLHCPFRVSALTCLECYSRVLCPHIRLVVGYGIPHFEV